MPAQAGISGGESAPMPPEIPAFAGMTIGPPEIPAFAGMTVTRLR
jgi:hypothetical protein